MNKDYELRVYIPDELREALEQIAQAHYRKLNEHVRYVLQEHVTQETDKKSEVVHA